MNLDAVLTLQTGDEVFWEDPDEGVCSKYIKIAQVSVDTEAEPPIVRIMGVDGDALECFVEELK